MTEDHLKALLASELALHQAVFTLFPTDVQEETYYGIVLEVVSEALDHVSASEFTVPEHGESGAFITAAMKWRDSGKKDDEAFTEALNSLEEMKNMGSNPKIG